MSDRLTCPICGFERPSGTAHDICPRCLLDAGRERNTLDASWPLPSQAQDEAPGAKEPGVLDSIEGTIGPVPRVLLRDSGPDEPSGPLVVSGSTEMPRTTGGPGRLQFLGEIARGGMGVVPQGRDPDLGRDLAIKVLRDDLRDDPEMIRRFVEEAQIAGQLQHPGVIPVYELGQFEDRRPYFSMKLVKGHTLAELLAGRADAVDDRPRILGIFEQVAQTIAYAHSRGVIHRDLKPSNVMVGSFGEVQVMDWGLAKVLPRCVVANGAPAAKAPKIDTVIATARSESDSDLSRAGSVLGTPPYMAPEQSRGEVDAVDARSDVFALGSMLCEVLTGQPAFVGGSSAEILRKSSRGEIGDALARLEACGADSELCALCARCLAAEREHRPRDAGVVSEGLAAYLAGVQSRLRGAELAAAEAVARAEAEARRWRAERQRRRAMLALAASVVSLLALGGLWGGVVLWERQARRSQLDGLIARASAALERAEHAAGAEADVIWDEAKVAAARAEESAGAAVDQTRRGRLRALRERVELDNGIRTLISRLQEARIHYGGKDDIDLADAQFSSAFRSLGLDPDEVPPGRFGEVFAGRAIAGEVAAGMDDWFVIRTTTSDGHQSKSGERIAAAARAVDPDPWRNELRSVRSRPRPERAGPLRQLASDRAALDRQPAVGLCLLANALDEKDESLAKTVLDAAWRRFPADYWVNIALAHRYREADQRAPEQAHLMAALAVRPANAGAHHMLAYSLRQTGKLDEAIAQYREAIRLKPGSAVIHFELAWTYRERGEVESAIAEYREAARLDLVAGQFGAAIGDLKGYLVVQLGRRPDDAIVAHQLAYLAMEPKNTKVRNRLAWTYFDQGKFEKALAEFREVVRLAPNDGPAHFQLAKALGAAGFRDQAMPEYNVALSLLGNDIKTRIEIGTIFKDLGKRDQAELVYREAIRSEPGNVPARQRLAELLKETGKRDLAAAEYREIVRLSPANLWAHLDLADKLREAGDRELAIALCRAVAELEPGNDRAHYSLALALQDSGQTDQAITEYRAAIRCNPHNLNTHFLLAPLLEKRGDLEGAIVEYRATAILDELVASVGGWAIGRLEKLLKKLGRPDETVHHFRVIVAKVPDNAEARARLAVALDRQGWNEEAASEFREARRLVARGADGQIPIDGARAHEMLGGFLKSHGMLDQALVEYREAARLAPENAGPKNEIAWLLLDLGRFQDALDQITIAVRAHGDSVWMWSSRGGMMARLRRWREARDDLSRAIELDPADHFFWYQALTVDLWLRDHESYGRRCRALLERFESTTDSVVAEIVSKVCLLGSPPSDIRARAVHLAERSLAPNAEKWKEGWQCATRALADYRAGDRDDAVKWALATPDGSWYHPGIIAEFVIAMAVYREGRADEARLWLELARGRLEAHGPAVDEIALPSDWHDILHLRLLLRESEQLIGTSSGLGDGKGDDQESPKQVRFPAELARGYSLLGVALQERREYERAEKAFRRANRLAPGDAGVAKKLERIVADSKAQARRLEQAIGRLPAMPQAADDQLELAQFCFEAGRHGAAAELWAAAFAAEPRLAESRKPLFRDLAARAAALAGAGRGKDAPSDPQARTRLRRRARDWLTAELNACRTFLAIGPFEREHVAARLRGWLTERDLAGIRDADALTTLPEAERAEWRTFWAGIADLLKRAEGE